MFLGIETSCDETAVALIDGKTIIEHLLYSQIREHQAYGGVVPQIAARAHGQHLPLLVKELFQKFPLSQLEGIAVTAGPGLIGGLLVGTLFAKGLALALNKPLWPIHHLIAHGLMVRFFEEVAFPYLLLLLSGGHCQLVWVEGCDQFGVLGETMDDAVGECIDKVARALGFSYPGGPAIERASESGDPYAIPLPVPLKGRPGCDFSFSGLKTACMQWISLQTLPLPPQLLSDFCASFQRVIADTLVERLSYAIKKTKASRVVLSGGVAANRYFYKRMQQVAPVISPPPSYCTDNAVMIAWAGYEKRAAGFKTELHFPTCARWPLPLASF